MIGEKHRRFTERYVLQFFLIVAFWAVIGRALGFSWPMRMCLDLLSLRAWGAIMRGVE